MATSFLAFQVSCSLDRSRSIVSDGLSTVQSTLTSDFKEQPILRGVPRVPIHIRVSKTLRSAASKVLDAFVDLAFKFYDHPLIPPQSNFAPVEELGQATPVPCTEGQIPENFPEGVYLRNGPNPLFGGLKETKSIFGWSSHSWIEGEGMLHALCFYKDSESNWIVVYNNRHVETETYKVESQKNKPCFLPAIEGDSPAILLAYLLNQLRFGKVNKDLSNTSVFEHAGKYYSVAENHIPQEIDIFTLKTLGNWGLSGAWNRPFCSHPKRVPGTGELAILGVDAIKPFLEVGIISADGKELVHKVDLGLKRCIICHEIGVTQRYNVIMDFPLTIDINRVIRGGPLIKYEREEYARIGVMPRYGDADSIKWFDVEPNCTFHIINSFECGHEVVVWGCRASDSIISSSVVSMDESECFSCCHEWRLNMETGEVRERYLTARNLYIDFPVINGSFTGLKNKYGYAQIVDPIASATSGMPKYRGLAKLYLDQPDISQQLEEELIKVEQHYFEDNIFCTGASFVPKEGGCEEDDGWIITFVHNEDTDMSQVYVIDTKEFSSKPVAKITLPRRVPYGFHGAFMPISLKNT